ncbi:hypothetical protein [Desertivirga arenae]|uniref:hypothetical protein n=1 Tax=Desertivirga arenae TaxID=2810309 RepID=UPI001A971B47|nr:hypothetical protein [Pedobacter sp. SYSU D00823]
MSEEAYHNLLSRYLSNELTLQETEDLLEWIGNDPDKEKLLRDFQETWDLAKDYPESFRVDTPAAWQRLRHSIKDISAPAATTTIPVNKWIVIAAAFIILIVGLILVFQYFLVK